MSARHGVGEHLAPQLGDHPLTDHTVEQRLAVLAQFANHLDRHGVTDWATCSRGDIEAFLATGRDRGFRLAALRDFFPLRPPAADLPH